MTLTPQAAADLAWLRQALPSRVFGPELRPSGEYEVTLIRKVPLREYPGQMDEKRQWHLGPDPETALRRARNAVEDVIEKARGA